MDSRISKRALCILVCLAIAALWALGSLPRTYAATDGIQTTTAAGCSGTDHTAGTLPNGLIYEITDGNAVITGYDGNDETVEIPDRISGCSVTEIGFGAFDSEKDLKTVVFPDSITEIGGNAFYGCENLEFPSLPSGLYKIGDFAFCGCASFTYVITPQALMELGKGAFSCCVGIQKMTVAESSAKYRAQNNCIIEKRSQILVSGCKNSVIPDGNVSKIGDYAFYGCKGLESAAIPDSVTEIGEYAFSCCDDLQKLKIGKSVAKIGEYAFSYCSALASVTVPDGVKEIPAYAFYGCEGVSELTLPSKSEKIGASAFHGCKALKEIDIPASVSAICKHAFTGCGIIDLFIPKAVFSIEAGAFSECSGLASITVEEGNVVYVSKGNCLIDKRAATVLSGCINSVIPETGVCIIGYCAFKGCRVTAMDIPDNITEIGFSAFENCSELETLTLPTGLDKIDSFAFSGCVSLEDVTFTKNISEIGINAFSGCVSLKKAELPDNLQTIGVKAFYGCTSLEKAVIGSGVSLIGDKAFSYCPGITSIEVARGNLKYHSDNNCVILTEDKTLVIGVKTSVIPDDGSVTIIESSAFFMNTALRSVTIPKNVKTVRFDAFAFCTGLESLYIGKSVMNIGLNAFRNCPSLEYIKVDAENVVFYSIDNCVIETRGKGLVLGCKTSKIPLDDRVRTICFGAFSGSDRLTYVVIPLSVSEIKDQAFKDCSSLRAVFYEGSKEDWEKIKIESENECLTDAHIFFGRRERIVPGDVTGDNATDSADAAFVLKTDAGFGDLSEEQLFAADVNKDGESDSSDAALILRYDAGISEIE